MPTHDSGPLNVLADYPDDFQPIRVESLAAAGGFSGAQFWRVTARVGTLCLRRWPTESPTVEELEFIHAVLRHVAQAGFPIVPVPFRNRHGRTCVHYAGHLWELAPWLSGQADYRQSPSPERLRAALRALAEFHRCTATFPSTQVREGASPGIHNRRNQLSRWMQSELERLAAAVRPGIWPEVEDSSKRILQLVPGLAPEVFAMLESHVHTLVHLEPCIRDIWHEHVLFSGDEVTGLVDFGSMRIESVAGDIARLLGSMAVDDVSAWQIGMEAYQTVRGLSTGEQQLIAAFDRSTILMSGLNWIDWIYRQHRRFGASQAIPFRLREIVTRLEHLAHTWGDSKLPWQQLAKLI